MRNFSRFLLLAFLLAGFALVGCSKQETPSETAATPAAAPKYTPPAAAATGNKDCNPNGKSCDIDSAQIYDEDHGPDKSKHSCDPWDDNSAIHVTTGTPGGGKFKKIVVKPGAGHGKFDITVHACPGSSGNPFPNAKNNGTHNGWDSGDVDPGAKPQSHYQLIMTETAPPAGGKAKKMQSDPHIVIDGTGAGNNR